jgi:hypothetical protein
MADVELMRRAGAKMANTMFNLAQHAGSVIDSDLAAKFDKMRKEWDAAVSAPSPASTAGERQSIDTLKFRALLSDVCAAYNSGTNVVMREQALIAHIDTWATPLFSTRQDAARFRKAISAEDNAEALYSAVLNNAPDTTAIRREFDATPAADIKADAAAGAARQGGNTSESSNESCAATPTNTAPAAQPDPVEVRAKEIYATFEGSERHPWIERGNSLMQDKARRLARAEVRDSAKESAEGSEG